jgi:YVTN family beta-propeller protein
MIARRLWMVVPAMTLALAGAEPAVAVKRASSPIAVTIDGRTVLAVSPPGGVLSVIDLVSRTVLAEIPVGTDPRTVAVDDSSRLAFVADRGSGTVSVVDLVSSTRLAAVAVGSRPYGVVVAPDGTRAWAACQDDGVVVEIDVGSLEVVRTIPVGDRPSGLAVSADGTNLLVTELLSGAVSIVDTGSGASTLVTLWPDSNLVQSVVLLPGDREALVPHTRSNTANRYLTFDTTLFPVVSRLDVAGRRHLPAANVPLDVIDPPGIGLPFDAAVAADGSTAWIVNAASNDLTVVDLASSQRLAHVEVGANPRGITLTPDGREAWVVNALDGTLSVVDAATFQVVATVTATRLPQPPALLVGQRLFWSSDDPRLARSQWIACASCHFDGEHDGRTWTFAFAGPRNTTSLGGMVQTYPLRWSAEWNEAADSEFAVTREQFGSGLLDGAMHEPLAAPNAERSFELDALAAYLDGLPSPPNRIASGLDPAAVARGADLFADPVVGCRGCHPSPYFTDFETHDVGTADGPGERLGPEIDTPGLRDLGRSAPYLHDGSAATLAAVLTTANANDLHGVTSHLSSGQVDDLEAYLLSLPAKPGGSGSSEHGLATVACHRVTPPAASADGPRRPSGRRSPGDPVRGRVVWDDGSGAPAAGSRVTLRATDTSVVTDADGRFTLVVPASAGEVEVAAWAPGAYIATETITAPASGLELRLRRLHQTDHSDYAWVAPSPDPATPKGCGNCHPSIVTQWEGNAHGGAIANPRFYSMYDGTDVTGAYTVEPGYRTDFPGTNGICAACHAPGRAVDNPFSTDADAARGDATAGIHCDFCHKTGGVYAAPGTAEVYPNMAGVLALEVLRPPPGDDVFFGPYADVADPDSYLPAMSESVFCAPCHQYSFWGTPIYTSYDEWRASPYADRKTGATCQSCHMPPNGDTFFANPENGGLWHPAEKVPSHLQLGLTQADFMADAISLDLEASSVGGVLTVAATVTNTGAGHHYPTDHPGRHLLLEIAAVDRNGRELELTSGTTIPSWGGDLAGRPGTGYARILEDVASGEWPVISYWKQALVRSDNRLAALASDRSEYEFADPGDAVTVTARLRFRRLFAPLAARYGWDPGDLLLAERVVSR